MIQSPNYIHFHSEWRLLGLDSPGQQIDRQRFQELLYKLNEHTIGADFDDFSFRSDRCEMGKFRGNNPQGGDAFSKLVYSNNILSLVEEWADTSADDFKEKFVRILSIWFELFPNTAIVIQNYCLRALVQPMKFKDSRVFLGNHVLKIGDSMNKIFSAMPFRVGFTVGCTREILGYKLYIDTTVNSWRDTRTVWVEVNGTSNLIQPVNATNFNETKKPFEVCKDFLETEVISLLKEFDTSSDVAETED
jgi:hypothetical protein